MDFYKTFNRHLGFIFEKICTELLFYIRPIEFNKIGKWWHKDKEIDIFALNEKTKVYCFDLKDMENFIKRKQ